MPLEWFFKVAVRCREGLFFSSSSPSLILGDLILQTSLFCLILAFWNYLEFMELIGDNLGVKFLRNPFLIWIPAVFILLLEFIPPSSEFLFGPNLFWNIFWISGTSGPNLRIFLGRIRPRWIFEGGHLLRQLSWFPGSGCNVLFPGPYLPRPMSFLSESKA